jgi:hypothetical protein
MRCHQRKSLTLHFAADDTLHVESGLRLNPHRWKQACGNASPLVEALTD